MGFFTNGRERAKDDRVLFISTNRGIPSMSPASKRKTQRQTGDLDALDRGIGASGTTDAGSFPDRASGPDWDRGPDEFGRPLRGEVQSEDFVSVASEAIKATARAATAQASDVVSNAGAQIAQSLSAEKDRGADSMRRFARAMGNAAGELDQQSPSIARYLQDAAHSVESFSDSIRNRDLRQLTDEATNFAKSQPALFFAGAVVAGFAIARFLKSTPPEVHQGSHITGADGAWTE
jgi:hypothetical protein